VESTLLAGGKSKKKKKRWKFWIFSSRIYISEADPRDCSCVHHGPAWPCITYVYVCSMYVTMSGNGVPPFRTHRSRHFGTCCGLGPGLRISAPPSIAIDAQLRCYGIDSRPPRPDLYLCAALIGVRRRCIAGARRKPGETLRDGCGSGCAVVLRRIRHAPGPTVGPSGSIIPGTDAAVVDGTTVPEPAADRRRAILSR
jgi:hypothetical protein